MRVWSGEVLDLHIALGDDPGFEHLGEHRSLRVVRPRADPVGVVDRLAGGRADLPDGEPPPVVGGDVEQQVGEAEVGQHAPLGREADEMLDLVAGERRVLAREISE